MPAWVLAVEDDATQRLVLEWELERLGKEWGFDFTTVADLGSARKEAAEREGQGFIVCDENLPDGQGVDFIREQKQNGHSGIVVTAGAPKRATGDVTVHVKPSSLDEQRMWLREVLQDAGFALPRPA